MVLAPSNPVTLPNVNAQPKVRKLRSYQVSRETVRNR